MRNDIELTVGMDVSPAEDSLKQLQTSINDLMNSAGGSTSSSATPKKSVRHKKRTPVSMFPDPGKSAYLNPSDWTGGGSVFLNQAERTKYNELQLKTLRSKLMKSFKLANDGYFTHGKKVSYVAPDPKGAEIYAAGVQRTEELLKSLKTSGIENVLSEEKDITKEKKAQNRELGEQAVKLFRNLGALYLIKKAVSAIVKGFKFLGGALNNQAQDFFSSRGFLTKDYNSAVYSNVDKQHEMISKGVSAYKGRLGFNMSDFDASLEKMQDLRLGAMSGQDISDNQYVISLQRVFDRLGVGVSAADALSNPDLDLTDIMVRLMSRVEKSIPGLKNLGGVDQSLALNDFKSILGPAILDALTANSNYNKKSGSTQTLIDRVIESGGAATPGVDTSESAMKFSTAAAELSESVEKIKRYVSDLFSPLMSKTLALVTWVLDKIGVSYEGKKAYASAKENFASSVISNSNIPSLFSDKYFGMKNTRDAAAGVSKEDIKKLKLLNKDKSGSVLAAEIQKKYRNGEASVYDLFNMEFFQAAAYGTGDLAAGLEFTVATQIAGLDAFENLSASQIKNVVQYNSGLTGLQKEVGKAVAAYMKAFNIKNFSVTDKKGYLSNIAESALIFAMSGYFDEGGVYDIKDEELRDISGYFERVLGKKKFREIIKDSFGGGENPWVNSGFATETRTYEDKDKHLIIEIKDASGGTKSYDFDSLPETTRLVNEIQ